MVGHRWSYLEIFFLISERAPSTRWSLPARVALRRKCLVWGVTRRGLSCWVWGLTTASYSSPKKASAQQHREFLRFFCIRREVRAVRVKPRNTDLFIASCCAYSGRDDSEKNCGTISPQCWRQWGQERRSSWQVTSTATWRLERDQGAGWSNTMWAIRNETQCGQLGVSQLVPKTRIRPDMWRFLKKKNKFTQWAPSLPKDFVYLLFWICFRHFFQMLLLFFWDMIFITLLSSFPRLVSSLTFLSLRFRRVVLLCLFFPPLCLIRSFQTISGSGSWQHRAHVGSHISCANLSWGARDWLRDIGRTVPAGRKTGTLWPEKQSCDQIHAVLRSDGTWTSWNLETDRVLSKCKCHHSFAAEKKRVRARGGHFEHGLWWPALVHPFLSFDCEPSFWVWNLHRPDSARLDMCAHDRLGKSISDGGLGLALSLSLSRMHPFLSPLPLSSSLFALPSSFSSSFCLPLSLLSAFFVSLLPSSPRRHHLKHRGPPVHASLDHQGRETFYQAYSRGSKLVEGITYDSVSCSLMPSSVCVPLPRHCCVHIWSLHRSCSSRLPGNLVFHGLEEIQMLPNVVSVFSSQPIHLSSALVQTKCLRHNCGLHGHPHECLPWPTTSFHLCQLPLTLSSMHADHRRNSWRNRQ